MPLHCKDISITYTIIHLIHLYSIFIYGGFLFVDNLFLSKMKETLSPQEASRARESIMIHVRKVVPYTLFVAVGSGIYLFTQVFGEIADEGMSRFQILLLLKSFLGLWLGFRGFNQKLFGINPWVFKSHLFPLLLVVIMIFLSQLMYL
ncbi:MAG: hypothetical protein MUP09_01000 [Thiovulaceae bacterium]|nr:hypothetical protein [Sulfurimonadaceae bacterium]